MEPFNWNKEEMMVDRKTHISTELKSMEDQYAYLSGIGYQPQVIMNLIYLAIESQKVNLQTKMLIQAKSEG